MGTRIIIKKADFSENGIDIVEKQYPYTVPMSARHYLESNCYFSTDSSYVTRFRYKPSGGAASQWAYIDLREFVGKNITFSITSGSYRCIYLDSVSDFVNATEDVVITQHVAYSTGMLNVNPGTITISSSMKFLCFATNVSGTETAGIEITISESSE